MKVKVPKFERPPTRFGVILGKPNSLSAGKAFKVKGIFRAPKDGEWFWSGWFEYPIIAAFDYDPEHPRVILEEVKD